MSTAMIAITTRSSTSVKPRRCAATLRRRPRMPAAASSPAATSVQLPGSGTATTLPAEPEL